MVRRRPGETEGEYIARLREIIAAVKRPEAIPTPEEKTRDRFRDALADVRQGAPFGYMAGPRLDDFRRIEEIARDLDTARRLAVPDLEERTAAAVREASMVADYWRERWD
jgi:hypothetical protein